MNPTAPQRIPTPLSAESLPDEELIARIRAGETALYEVVMRRYNRRLYRVIRAILHNETEADDVLQETYVRAYGSLHQFEGRAQFSTWLTRIAIHEALSRLRREARLTQFDPLSDRSLHLVEKRHSASPTPEWQTYDRELRIVLENALDSLPGIYRTVFILRVVEGLDTAETAGTLGLTPQAVKTRYHRARSLLRKAIHHRAGIVAADIFPFHLSRCDQVVAAVLQRI